MPYFIIYGTDFADSSLTDLDASTLKCYGMVPEIPSASVFAIYFSLQSSYQKVAGLAIGFRGKKAP